MRRLVLLTGSIVFVDTMFYAAITPLLPYLEDHLGLSKASAGVLVAAYPAGTFVGALPGGWLAARIGVKPLVLIGLALMAGASVVFGFAQNAAVLDAARFVQGVGGAFSWAGAMTWLVSEAPRERRGELIGTALGAAIVGALFGPVVGALSVAIGPQVVFSGVVVLAAGLAIAAWGTPAAPATPGPIMAALWRARSSPQVRGSLWLVLLPALVAGVFEVLMPLRLDALGASSLAIGAVFLVAAAVEAAVSPFIGRLSDRRGRLVPIRFGLTVVPVLVLLLALPRSPVIFAVLVALSWMGLGCFWSPAMAALSDSAEAAGLALGLAWALINLAWSSGQTVGAAGGAGLAELTADIVPYAIIAALCVATLVALRHVLGRTADVGRGPLPRRIR